MTSTSKNIATVWTSHLKSKEDKEDFENTLRSRLNGDSITDRLVAIIKNRLDQIERQESSITNYDSSAWPYRQADMNGRRAELKVLLSLLTIKETK